MVTLPVGSTTAYRSRTGSIPVCIHSMKTPPAGGRRAAAAWGWAPRPTSSHTAIPPAAVRVRQSIRECTKALSAASPHQYTGNSTAALLPCSPATKPWPAACVTAGSRASYAFNAAHEPLRGTSDVGSAELIRTAAAAAVRINSALPTSLVPRNGSCAALKAYEARLPAVTQAAGHGLVAGLHGKSAAVEFPVYWCGLAADNAFVHSRIDCLTRTAAGGIAVWDEVGRGAQPQAAAARRPPAGGVFMLWMQTGIEPVRLRYAVVDPTGSVTIVTHGYAFDGHKVKWALRDVLRNTTAYVDAKFASLDDLARAVQSGSATSRSSTRGRRPSRPSRCRRRVFGAARCGSLQPVYAHTENRDAQLRFDAEGAAMRGLERG